MSERAGAAEIGFPALGSGNIGDSESQIYLNGLSAKSNLKEDA